MWKRGPLFLESPACVTLATPAILIPSYRHLGIRHSCLHVCLSLCLTSVCLFSYFLSLTDCTMFLYVCFLCVVSLQLSHTSCLLFSYFKLDLHPNLSLIFHQYTLLSLTVTFILYECLSLILSCFLVLTFSHPVFLPTYLSCFSCLSTYHSNPVFILCFLPSLPSLPQFLIWFLSLFLFNSHTRTHQFKHTFKFYLSVFFLFFFKLCVFLCVIQSPLPPTLCLFILLFFASSSSRSYKGMLFCLLFCIRGLQSCNHYI